MFCLKTKKAEALTATQCGSVHYTAVWVNPHQYYQPAQSQHTHIQVNNQVQVQNDHWQLLVVQIGQEAVVHAACQSLTTEMVLSVKRSL